MTKWKNQSAGPRQVKDLNHAISALQGEGKTVVEVTGVVGGEERRSAYMMLMSPPRAEVAELEEKIGGKYDWQVTRENVRAIIADYEAALPEARKSRPVDDKRRSPEEDAELRALMAQREAEMKARQEAADAVLAQVTAKAPRGAKALIIAEYHEDASDPQTDYFNSRVTRTVAIGFRFSSREDFKALRAAAGQFPETAHLATDEDAEHRENYSMGGGNYLSDHGSSRAGTGWVVKSADLPAKWVNLTEDAIPEQPAAPAAAASGGAVTVSPSSIGREGVVEIRFAEKPSAEVLADLKFHGFKWARGNRCWYGTDTKYAEALASGQTA